MNEQNQAVEKALSNIISEEAAREVANLEGTALIEAFGLIDEQMAIKKLHLEEMTVKGLLDSLGNVIVEIMNTEEGKVYPVKIVDGSGEREEMETAFQRTKDLGNIALESFLWPLYDLLGYEVTTGESK